MLNQITALFINKVHAQVSIPVPTTGAGTLAIGNNLGSLVTFVVNLVFGVGLALSLIFVIIGGIKYVTSQGNQDKAEEARNTITNAIIGAVVIIAFRVIIGIVLNLIGAGDLGTYLQGSSGS